MSDSVGIVDYGRGNLASVQRAISFLGGNAVRLSAPSELGGVSRVILPGVGSFKDGMDALQAGGWIPALRDWVSAERGPLLGICLGMQMLATEGEEGGRVEGLGVIPGRIVRMTAAGPGVRIPHVGWNESRWSESVTPALFAQVPTGSDFYFVHSYCFLHEQSSDVVGVTHHGVDFTSAVARGQVWGVQFHPEKSGKPGLQLLRNFLAWSPS